MPAPEHGGRVDWAIVPRVNLLPREIIDTRRFRLVQRALIGVVLLVGVLCGLLTFWEQTEVTEARTDLGATQKEGLALQLEQRKYEKVPKVHKELEAARAARERALGTDVLWSPFLIDLAMNTPSGAVLKSVQISMDGTTTASTAPNDPTIPGGLGTVKVTGEASFFPDVASWLTATAEVHGLAGTRLESAARTKDKYTPEERVAYSGNIVIMPDALSHRYDRNRD